MKQKNKIKNTGRACKRQAALLAKTSAADSLSCKIATEEKKTN